MATTIDARPSTFGNMLVVTGTYGAGDASVDLSELFGQILFAGANASTDIAGVDFGGVAHYTGPQIEIDGTTLRFKTADAGDVAGTAGTFMAIGHRG